MGQGRRVRLKLGAGSVGEPGVALGGGQVQGLLELGNGLVGFALARKRHPQVIMGLREIRFELQGLLVVFDGVRPIALHGQRMAQIIVGLRIVRLELQRPFEVRNGLGHFPLHGQGVV